MQSIVDDQLTLPLSKLPKFVSMRSRRLLAPCLAWHLHRPVDHVVFVVLNLDPCLGYSPPTHRHAGLMHRVRITGNKRMPPVEVLPFAHQTIGASRRKPGQRPHFLRRQLDAVGHVLRPVGIVAAPAAGIIQQLAGDVGPDNLTGVPVLKLVEAAAGTAVAQRLPFACRHFLQRLQAPVGFRLAGVDRGILGVRH